MKSKQFQTNSIDLTALKRKYKIRECFVKLTARKRHLNNNKDEGNRCEIEESERIEVSEQVKDIAMDSVKRRPGSPSNASLAAAAAATGTTPVKPPPAKSTPKPKAAVKKPVPETPVEVLEGGRSKRTPKPNPRYMNDTVYSSSKSAIRDDSTASEEEFGELGSSDDFDAPVDTPIKKRPLDKGTPKTAPPKQYAKKPMNAAKAMAHQLSRRTLGGALIGADKRKWSGSEFDIDDEHGKELFLAAKRRLTHVS